MMQINIEYLDDVPNIQINGLKIWIHGWQFPDEVEGYDSNWLHVTALCEAKNAVVWREGNFITSDNLISLLKVIKNDLLIYNDHGFGNDYAYSNCDEPYFEWSFHYIHLPPTDEDEYGVGESLKMIVDITPDHHDQSHRFSWDIDFDKLNEVVSQLEKIIKKYAPRD